MPAPPAREVRLRADAARNRQAIIGTARKLYGKRGLDVPFDEIARAAGVGNATLYRHFPTRLDLQAAVYRSQVQSVCEAADELLAAMPPEQALIGWVHALGSYLVTKRVSHRLRP